MKLIPTTLLLLLVFLGAQNCLAQNNIVFGQIVYQESKEPIVEATISIPALKIITTTNGEGAFSFVTQKTGIFEAKVSTDGFNSFAVSIAVGLGSTTIPTIEILVEKASLNTFVNDISAIGYDDVTSTEDGAAISSGQNISSVLNAARDPFLSAATFGWGQFFYRLRGYDNDQNTLFINGIPLNDLEEGGVYYNAISGLNDVFRGRSIQLGLQPTDYAYGGYGLNTFIDATASAQRPQTSFSYASTNRNYRHRLMLTHSTGMNKTGWAFSFSLSKRWAEEGPIAGTFYDAYGYYAAVEKKYKNHDLSFIIVGAPIVRGKNGPATAEAAGLAGTNYYNPYWGYQTQKDGSRVKRNTRVASSHAPLFILTHTWDVTQNTKLSTAVGYQNGETATTNIDWYNAADPRPDYYRYLPSYYETPSVREAVKNKILSNPEEFLQVNWDAMYQANYFNKQLGDGRAAYILGADVEAARRFNANINLQHLVNENVTFNAGVIYQEQKNHNFRRVEDLLGSNYWLNINQFAERDFQNSPTVSQLDLNQPNERKTVGDIYGYNYNTFFRSLAFFTQATFKYNHFDFFITHEVGNKNYFREGLYKSGLYPTNSFGKSAEQNFNTSRSKAGITYKINGRNYIYANGALGSQAPLVDNVFISPRTRNQTIDNPQLERIKTAEVGYLLRSPNFKGRLTGYATDITNAVDIKRYYYDTYRSFSNMVLQNLNKRFIGIELGAEIKLTPSLSLNLAANLSQAFYTSRAFVQEYIDNDTNAVELRNNSFLQDSVYLKNYNLPTGPRTALQANLFYRSPKYWFGSVAVNYMDDKWLDFAPTARTFNATSGLAAESAEYKTLTQQLKVEPFMTIDVFMGKSFKLDNYFQKTTNKMMVFINLGVSNILNKQDIVLYGFENLRTGTVSPDRLEQFAPRYAYNLGIQYFFNVSVTF